MVVTEGLVLAVTGVMSGLAGVLVIARAAAVRIDPMAALRHD